MPDNLKAVFDRGQEGEIINPTDDRGNVNTADQGPREGNTAMAPCRRQGYIQWDPTLSFQAYKFTCCDLKVSIIEDDIDSKLQTSL